MRPHAQWHPAYGCTQAAPRIARCRLNPRDAEPWKRRESEGSAHPLLSKRRLIGTTSVVKSRLSQEEGTHVSYQHNILISHGHKNDALIGDLKKLHSGSGSEIRD